MNYLYFFLLASFWGGSFIAIQKVVMYLPPYFSAFLRVFFALLILTVLLKLLGKKMAIPLNQVWKSWLSGLFSIGIPFSLLFWGERFINPGLAAILNALVPILTFVIAMVFTPQDEPFRWNKVFGVIFALLGTFIIFYPKMILPGHQQALLGSLAVFGMAVGYAIGVILNRIVAKTTNIQFHANLIHQHISSAVYLILISVLFEPIPSLDQILQMQVVIPIAYLAIFSTAIAFMIFFHLIKVWGSLKASMVTYLTPLLTIVFGYLLNNTLPKPYEIFGAGFIFIGMMLTQNVLRYQFKKPLVMAYNKLLNVFL